MIWVCANSGEVPSFVGMTSLIGQFLDLGFVVMLGRFLSSRSPDEGSGLHSFGMTASIGRFIDLGVVLMLRGVSTTPR